MDWLTISGVVPCPVTISSMAISAGSRLNWTMRPDRRPGLLDCEGGHVKAGGAGERENPAVAILHVCTNPQPC
jgi:hypothetical protein